jgi:integrase
MASVYLNAKKSQYWIGCFTVDGKQVQRSTRTTDKTAAEAIAATWEIVGGKALTGDLTEEYLRDTNSFILRLAGRDDGQIPTIREWLNSWVENARLSLSDGTYKRYHGIKDHLFDLLGKKIDKSLQTLSQNDIETFRQYLLDRGLSRKSVNLGLKALRRCLNRALPQNYIASNRAMAVDLVLKEEGPEFGKRPFTGPELARIMAAAPTTEWLNLMKCGYYLGDRIGNLVKLRFEYFNLAEGLLRYTPGKQRTGAKLKIIEIPLHPEISTLIAGFGKTSGPVFPTLCKKRVGGKTGLSLSFRAIMDAAGIVYKSKAPRPSNAPRGKGGRTVHELGFHSLRRSFNSDLANKGVSQEIRQLLIGHASKTVNDGYTTMQRRILSEAVNKLSSLHDLANSGDGQKSTQSTSPANSTSKIQPTRARS